MESALKFCAIIVLAIAAFFLSAKCIDRLTPEYMKNCSGFGHAGMCFIGGAVTSIALLCMNAFSLASEKERSAEESIVGCAIASILAFFLGTGLSFSFYWLMHHSGGHVCHAWSP
ncbi:MAG: hypothetical protein JWR26_4082 [Pedosphaera sp.]|nr:hypothetical protein [Pedosphaera sp.]